MCQQFNSVHLCLFNKKKLLLIFLSLGLMALASCRLTSQEYSISDQYELAKNRIDNMKEQLGFKITLEKKLVPVDEKIWFMAHFENKTEKPLTLRLPQQSGVLDISHPNTILHYSISPLDKTVSLLTPLSYLGMPYMFANPVQINDFVILDPHTTKDVTLEIPNTVYLKQGETWFETTLPPGRYLLRMTYENLNIGYEIEKKDQTYVVDKAAWVGQVDAEPVLLTISP